MIALNYLATLLSNVQQAADIAANSTTKINDWESTMGGAIAIGLAFVGLCAILDKIENKRKTRYTKCDLGRLQAGIAKYAQSQKESAHPVLKDFAKQVSLVEPLFLMNLIINFIDNLDNQGVAVLRDSIKNIKTTNYLQGFLNFLLDRREFYNNDRVNAEKWTANKPLESQSPVMHRLNQVVIEKINADQNVTLDDFVAFVNGLDSTEELKDLHQYVKSRQSLLPLKTYKIADIAIGNKFVEIYEKQGIITKVSAPRAHRRCRQH